MRPFLLGLVLILTACVPAAGSLQTPTSANQNLTAASTTPVGASRSATPALENTPSPETPAPSATLKPSATSSPAELTICSPLEGISLAELTQPDLMKNPFQPPRPGMDDGHHGTDFAYWSRGDRKTMLGLPVLAALAGRMAGIIRNRQPYGNAIIIETPLKDIPSERFAALLIPTIAPTVQPATSLFCPPDPAADYTHPGRSLYLLYAHLNKTPPGSIGDQVSCGQPIGEVGTTGKSVNPHLHLETRVGPAGATFPVMAHYENDASTEEMHAYCTWRVSGLFQMFDPLNLFSAISSQ